MKHFALLLGLVGLLRADFRYEQHTKGVEAPTVVSYKFQRLAVADKQGTAILDLNKRTFTYLDHGAKAYWQWSTFDFEELERAEALKVDVTFDAKAPGVTQEIDGVKAERLLLRLRAPDLEVHCEVWLADAVAGAEDYRAMYELYKERGTWMMLSQLRQPQFENPVHFAVAQKLALELLRLPGIPLRMTTRTYRPVQATETAAKAKPKNEVVYIDPAEDPTQRPRSTRMGERIGGALGGQAGASLGTIIAEKVAKKKPPTNRKPDATEPEPEEPELPVSEFPLAGESVTESKNFSTGSLDEGAFAIPAGYQKGADPFTIRYKTSPSQGAK
jgi:hypothetical protein